MILAQPEIHLQPSLAVLRVQVHTVPDSRLQLIGNGDLEDVPVYEFGS